MKKFAVIVAGGNGNRMGSLTPKQFLELKGKSLLWHSIAAFAKTIHDIQIILVLPELFLSEGEKFRQEFPQTNIQIIKGGETRFHSVKNGLALVEKSAVVFVHDAVRCLVSTELINNCYQQTIEKGSAIPAVAATDSIRLMKGNEHEVVDRNNIRIIQTPQTFLSDILLPAFDQSYKESFTDEATVVESFGQKVFLIEGEYSNIKITRPVDLLIAEQILKG